MKVTVVLVTIILAVNATDDEQWKNFKRTYNKQYSGQEEASRFAVFKNNLRVINQHNARFKNGTESYFMRITEFTDLTDNEFEDNYLNYGIPDAREITYVDTNVEDVPTRVDWRERGAVLRVKHQGKCQSSWAFSTTGVLEGQNFVKHNISIPLSEQNLIDCSDENEGCDGGEMEAALNFLKTNRISIEAGYPYTGRGATCVNGIDSRVHVNGVRVFPPGENSLQAAVGTYGPVAVAFNAKPMKLYGGGIFSNTRCSDSLNYAGLAVGYGSRGGKDYWIIKLSFGEKFGENGYVYLVRNQVRQCGISLVNLIPLLS